MGRDLAQEITPISQEIKNSLSKVGGGGGGLSQSGERDFVDMLIY